MSGVQKTLRQSRTIIVVPLVDIAGVPTILGGTAAAPILAPFANPTTAVLNTWQAVTTAAPPLGSHGGNISANVLDNVKLGLGASSTDSTLTVVSVGNEVSPTLKKINAVLEGFRDLDTAAVGVMNLMWQLFRSRGNRYAIFDRVQANRKATDPFQVGDVVSGYSVTTDWSIDNTPDQKYVTFTQTPKPDGLVLPEYTLTA